MALRLNGHVVTIAGPQASDLTWLKEHGVSQIPLSELTQPEDGVRTLMRAHSSIGYDAIINNDNPYVQSIAPIVACHLFDISPID